MSAATLPLVAPLASGSVLSASEHLVQAIQDLSLARSLEEVMAIVRTAARRLTGADGATFVLRDGAHCYYADEDAVAQLWKGNRFPLEACISGWTMLNRQYVALEDISRDPRLPADAYRPTFVKSLVMVPIRPRVPIGAIGTYWATKHTPQPEEVKLLQALANSTSIALENVELINNLEQRVQQRTAELAAAHRRAGRSEPRAGSLFVLGVARFACPASAHRRLRSDVGGGRRPFAR